MEDTLISFDTALLAKEKGFNYKSEYYFSPQDPNHSFPKGHARYGKYNLIHKSYEYTNNSNIEYHYFAGDLELTIPAPTQSLLQKWLREVHNIHIKVCSNNNDWYFILESIDYSKSLEFKSQCEKDYGTYEEALEEALKESLKLINNE